MKPPEVGKGFRLPAKKSGLPPVPPGISGRLHSIPLFGSYWKEAGDALGHLISTIKEKDVDRLLASLAGMNTPPPIMETSAVKWFEALTNLPSDVVVVGVQEFFHLSWVWNQIGPATGLVFEDLIALFYKVLQVLAEAPGDLALSGLLIQKGIRWPERFGFMLERTRIGGGNVVRALQKASELMKECDPALHESLLDFSVVTGWYLLSEEDAPIWRSIGRCGEALYRKLRGFSVPLETIRTLSGFLGRMEDEEQLDHLISDALKEVVLDINEKAAPENIHRILEQLSDEALSALSRRAERNICLDLLSLPAAESTEALGYGRAIAEMILFTGAGIAFYNAFREAYNVIMKTQDPRTVALLARLASERIGSDYLDSGKPEFYLDFLPLVLKFLEETAGLPERKRMINSLGRLMDAVLEQEDPEGTISELQAFMETVETDLDKLLTSLILLLRFSRHREFQLILSRCEGFTQLLSHLDHEYRRRLLEGEQVEWLDPLLERDESVTDLILENLGSITREELRGRFMDNVISPLIQAAETDEPVFDELLSTAVSTYNREMSIEQLREEESALLGKLFRAEDRSKALKKTMENLLRIPGIEQRNASELIRTARLLCETLSQQAVWIEKTGHRIFSKFLSYGLTALVKALVEYPDIAERMTGTFMRDIIDTIIPSKETEDSDVALWQLKTASIFFGKIIPRTIELVFEKPDRIMDYLSELSELTVSSKHGEPAGAAFLSWLAKRLESQLIEEFARKLTEDSPFKEFDEKFDQNRLYGTWRKSRDESSLIMNDMLESMQFVVSDPVYRQLLLREGRKLIEGFIENGCGDIISRSTGRAGRSEVETLARTADGTDIIEVFRALESGDRKSIEKTVPREVQDFFDGRSCPPGQNPCRNWRQNAFTTFENVMIDIIMLSVDKKSLEKIEEMIDDFVQIIGYLGTDSDFKPDIVLKSLENSLTISEGTGPISVDTVVGNLDRNVYKLMWLRKATRKAAESVSGYVPGRKISIRLFDRISREEYARDQILFMKNFGRIFAALESEIMKRKPSVIKSARSVLDHLWIFNPDTMKPGSPVDTARDAVETIAQFFLEISTRTGAVSATEAGTISLGMRRKYRDNANTVAILIKWTQDSSRSDLLSIVEAHQPLLEAVSRDSELIQMIDSLWSNGKARLYIRSLADRPDKLKKSLLKFTDKNSSTGNDGLHFI